MAVTSDKTGPYTSPAPVIDLIQRHRTRGLPSPVDAEVLRRAGISESLIARTLQSMEVLDLIDDKGQITAVFEGIRLAPEAEYKARMQEWLNAAYADVLAFADPAKDDETKIRDAFRNYKPVGQQDRMVTLFIKLYAAAGIAPERVTAAPARTRTIVGRVAAPRTSTRAPVTGAADPAPLKGNLPVALQGLLQSLPKEGDGWSQDRRDKFLAAFGVLLDFCFPIRANENEDNG